MDQPSYFAGHQSGVKYATRTQRAFMCKVDFEHHIDTTGAFLYASIDDLKADRECVAQCGIVEVEIRLLEVHQYQDYSNISDDESE